MVELEWDESSKKRESQNQNTKVRGKLRKEKAVHAEGRSCLLTPSRNGTKRSPVSRKLAVWWGQASIRPAWFPMVRGNVRHWSLLLKEISVTHFWKKLSSHFACPISNDSVPCVHYLAFPSLGVAGAPVQPLWHHIQEEWPGTQGYRKRTLLLPWDFLPFFERKEKRGGE